MKDEIKEILDNKLYFDLEEEDYIKIKDYITNLQEENKDYKSRIEKAIEYIKENQDMVEWIHIPVWELLNILQGVDKDE